MNPGPSHPSNKLPPAPGGPGQAPPSSASTPFSGGPPPSATEPSSSGSGGMVPVNNAGGGFLEDMDPHNMPPEYKKEGTDWFAIFNPQVPRVLDVNLVHTLLHERCVLWCLHRHPTRG